MSRIWCPGDVFRAQLTLVGSDGATWVAMARPTFTFTPPLDGQLLLQAELTTFADALTYTQDVGIYVAGGIYPTLAGAPETWQKNGAVGAYIPMPIRLGVLLPVLAGVAYTCGLRWRCAINAPGHTIFAGADNASNGIFCPTKLDGVLLA